MPSAAVVANFATTGSTANCIPDPADYHKELYEDKWTENGYVFTRDDGNLMDPDSITNCLKNFSESNAVLTSIPAHIGNTAACGK